MALGLIVLLELLNIVKDNSLYEMLWPAMIFLTGLILAGNPTSRFFGGIVIWVGFLLLLRQLHVFDSNTGEGLLAVLLAITGLGIIIGLGDKASHK